MRCYDVLVWCIVAMCLVSSVVVVDCYHVVTMWGVVGCLPHIEQDMLKFTIFLFCCVIGEWYVVMRNPSYGINAVVAWLVSLLWLSSAWRATVIVRRDIESAWRSGSPNQDSLHWTWRTTLCAATLVSLDLAAADQCVIAGGACAMALAVRRRDMRPSIGVIVAAALADVGFMVHERTSTYSELCTAGCAAASLVGLFVHVCVA